MNKDGNKNKISLGLKDFKISKNKYSGTLNKAINLESIKKSKYTSPNKKTIINKKRTVKINSYSSSNDNRKEPNYVGLKMKNVKNYKFKINLKTSNIYNNSRLKNNININSISKGKLDKLNISKNNNKNGINIHCSFFLNDLSTKYNRNLYLFNRTSDSLNKANSQNKNNSTNKKSNSLNKENNKIKINKNLKNKICNNHINNIRLINIVNKNKPKDIRQYYSINTLTTPYNIYNTQTSHSRTYTSKNKISPVSNKTSKEKQNFNHKLDKLKHVKNQKLLKKSKFVFESTNNSSSKNMIKNNYKTRMKPLNQNINSRNIRYNNSNITNYNQINNNNKSTLVNIKHINNKIMNFIDLNNKIKKFSPKKGSFEKYNTMNHSPNNALDKKIFFNLNISKIIQENNLIKEKNDNLSMQINDMTKEFENMKKENLIIKKELKEKSKMIKDMKLTIDIFNQELNKLQILSKKMNENNNNNQNNNRSYNIYKNIKDKKI